MKKIIFVLALMPIGNAFGVYETEKQYNTI